MNQVINKDAVFPQVDGRDYVQGVTILEHMAKAVLELAGTDSCNISRVKFTKRTLLDGNIKAQLGATDLPVAGSGATSNGEVDGVPFLAAFFPDDARKVSWQTTSPPYPYSGLDITAPYCCSAEVNCSDGPEFLWTLIEINKQSIARSLKRSQQKARIEFVEATDFIYHEQDMVAPGNVNIVNVGLREFGSRLYVLNEANYRDASGTPQQLRLQYTVEI